MNVKQMSLLAILSAPGIAAAATCAVDVEANDAMQFNTKAIEVSKSCKEFTINLKHVGKLPKAVMGHNLVIAKAADQQAVLTDGQAAGSAGDYIKAGDSRVVAHTKLIGGGEQDSVKFAPAKLADGDYAFFCSFPGHAAMMKGTVKVSK